jgi:ABC-type nitrate/sulfonate/bicarbonate transport system substrate-binding protein
MEIDDEGNGIFVLAAGPVRKPQDLAGRLIATHQGAHAIHRYLLRHVYGVDDGTLRWESHPQERLLDALRSGKADAVVLIDHFFFRGAMADGVRCLYTDGEAWRKLHGFDQMIKHIIAAREDLLQRYPGIKDKLLAAFRRSFAYSDAHLEEIAEEFVARYGGDKEALWLQPVIRRSSSLSPKRAKARRRNGNAGGGGRIPPRPLALFRF